MQKHHSRGSGMSSCTALLEPTVTFIHLQQCDELCDKFLVGFSIYTGFKKQRSNYSTPRNGTPHAYCLWMHRSFSVIIWVFISPCLVVLQNFLIIFATALFTGTSLPNFSKKTLSTVDVRHRS